MKNLIVMELILEIHIKVHILKTFRRFLNLNNQVFKIRYFCKYKIRVFFNSKDCWLHKYKDDNNQLINSKITHLIWIFLTHLYVIRCWAACCSANIVVGNSCLQVPMCLYVLHREPNWCICFHSTSLNNVKSCSLYGNMKFSDYSSIIASTIATISFVMLSTSTSFIHNMMCACTEPKWKYNANLDNFGLLLA